MDRAAYFTPGPRFFKAGDEVMFEFVIDAGNVIGPRKATDADKAKHADAWAKYERPGAQEEAAPGPGRKKKR